METSLLYVGEVWRQFSDKNIFKIFGRIGTTIAWHHQRTRRDLVVGACCYPKTKKRKRTSDEVASEASIPDSEPEKESLEAICFDCKVGREVEVR